MAAKLRQDILPFKIGKSDEPLMARVGLVLPYEMARAVKLPQVIDRELPPSGSGHAYNLFQTLKLLGLPAWWLTATIGRVRWKLYQVLLKLVTSVGRINLFRQVCHRCLQVGYG